MIEETDTRVHDATGGHPKVRAPASILITVSQSQAEPTSAGSIRTTILIPRKRPAGPIKILIEVHIAGLRADGEPVPEEVGAPQLLAVTVAA